MIMKMMFAAIALAVAVAAPSMASAQALEQSKMVTNRNALQQHNAQMVRQRRHSGNPAYDVYATDGLYVGSDPDSRVRQSLYFDDAVRGYD
jgi:hypothetical protein